MVHLLVAQSGLDGQQLGNSNVASAVWGVWQQQQGALAAKSD